MKRILVIDGTNRQCSFAFERFIKPEISADIRVDYAGNWPDALKLFTKKSYDMVVLERILISKGTDYLQAVIKKLSKKLGMRQGSVHVPGFSGEKMGSLLIFAEDCICKMQEIREGTKYVICNHSGSGYSKERRTRLSEMDNVVGVLNFIVAKKHKQMMLRLIKEYVAE